MSISEAKWTFAPFVLASSITSDLLLTFVRSHAGILSSFSHSLSTAASAAGIFIAWGIGIICVPNLNVAVNCPHFLQYGPHDNFGRDSSVRSLLDSLASKIHANFDLKSRVLPRVSPCLFFLHVLEGMAGAVVVSNFFRAFLMVSLN